MQVIECSNYEYFVTQIFIFTRIQNYRKSNITVTVTVLIVTRCGLNNLNYLVFKILLHINLLKIISDIVQGHHTYIRE